MKIRHLSHWDLDGITSVINVLNFIPKNADYQWKASGYTKIDKLIDEIDKDFDVLFITDLNYTEQQLRKIGSFKTDKNIIIYIDHHVYEFDVHDLCEKLHITLKLDSSKCACIQLYEFLNNSKISHLYELNRIVNIYDIWDTSNEDFMKLSYPLNALFWKYNAEKFIEKFKNGYHLDEEDNLILEKNTNERTAYLKDSMSNHSYIYNNLLIIMNANIYFVNDFTIFYPEYDVYLILNGFKDSQFTFSLRISNKINLTTHEIHDRIMKEVKIISGGHEKTSGIAVSESDIEQFMEVFIHIMKELL
ncbi:hypothetical protein GW796_09345 [archaeon]|nr:hypothetical protein [archaeon]NCT58933.1 hypothetical protein [archaeon]